MKLIFTLLFLFLVSPCYSVEFLIKVSPHYMDSLTPQEVNNLSDKMKAAYDRRIQPGDVIVVRPDGWEWGSKEKLPLNIVIKIPEMTMVEAQKYEEKIHDKDFKVLRRRKYNFNKGYIQQQKSANKSSVGLSKAVGLQKIEENTHAQANNNPVVPNNTVPIP